MLATAQSESRQRRRDGGAAGVSGAPPQHRALHPGDERCGGTCAGSVGAGARGRVSDAAPLHARRALHPLRQAPTIYIYKILLIDGPIRQHITYRRCRRSQTRLSHPPPRDCPAVHPGGGQKPMEKIPGKKTNGVRSSLFVNK